MEAAGGTLVSNTLAAGDMGKGWSGELTSEAVMVTQKGKK